MASTYDLKPRFQALLRPLSTRFASAGITANQLTITALLLSIASGAAIAVWPGQRWSLLLLPLVLLLRMALNAIDGMLAREHTMASPLGAVLNELGDVVSDTALYLPLALVPGVPVVLIIFIVILAIISEMTGVVAVQIGAERRYEGPMGKSDRALVFGTISLLLGLGIGAGQWLDGVLLLLVLLLSVTIYNRARCALAAAA